MTKEEWADDAGQAGSPATDGAEQANGHATDAATQADNYPTDDAAQNNGLPMNGAATQASAHPQPTGPAQEAAFRAELFERGLRMLSSIDGEAGVKVIESLADVSPDLASHIVSWGFGDIYSRPGLCPRDRQLVTLGMLTALGGCEAQLKVHVGASLNVGLTPQEIVEALLHAAGYCGFPRSLNATYAAREVFAERGLLPLEAPDGQDKGA